MAGKKQAVVVGVNKYADPTIPELKGAEKDAKEIRDILTEHGDFEVDEDHCLLDRGPRTRRCAEQSAIFSGGRIRAR